MSFKKGITLTAVWLLGQVRCFIVSFGIVGCHISFESTSLNITCLYYFQGIWMLPAYYLEFEGMNSFIWIWVAGILFFLINIAVIAAIIDSYVYTPWGQIYQKSEWDFSWAICCTEFDYTSKRTTQLTIILAVLLQQSRFFLALLVPKIYWYGIY